MKTSRLLFSAVASALVAGLLAGCAARQHSMAHHAGQDMNAMCDMHRQMMSGKTPEQQRAMMEEHMKTPEMRQHFQMMQERCK